MNLHTKPGFGTGPQQQVSGEDVVCPPGGRERGPAPGCAGSVPTPVRLHPSGPSPESVAELTGGVTIAASVHELTVESGSHTPRTSRTLPSLARTDERERATARRLRHAGFGCRRRSLSRAEANARSVRPECSRTRPPRSTAPHSPQVWTPAGTYGKFEAKASPFKAGMNPTNATQPKATLSPASYHRASQSRKVSIGRLGAASRRNGRVHAHRRGNNRSGNTWFRFVRRPRRTRNSAGIRRQRLCTRGGDGSPKTRPVRGCTSPSSAEYGRWHDPCPPAFQPLAVARYSDASVRYAVSGAAQADTASISDTEYT